MGIARLSPDTTDHSSDSHLFDSGLPKNPTFSQLHGDSPKNIDDRNIIIYAILKNTADKGAGLA
jgi:hypothetical protein